MFQALWSPTAALSRTYSRSYYRFLSSAVFCNGNGESRCFHQSSPGGIPARFRQNRRRYGGHSSRQSGRILIDKYVKHFCYDGALVVLAPCQVEVKGSHFDDNLNVDKATNHYCSSMIDSKTDSESPEEKDSKSNSKSYWKKLQRQSGAW